MTNVRHTVVRIAYWIAEDSPDIDCDDNVPVWHSNQSTSNSKVTMGDQLTPTQQEDSQRVLDDFQGVMHEDYTQAWQNYGDATHS
jgi:hypothetical protein